MSLFQKSVLKNQPQDEKLLAERYANYQSYKAKTDAIKSFKEEIYQDGFLHDVFEKCLGYTLKTTNPTNYNLDREQKNETDGKKADGSIIIDGKVVGVIELKDQKSKNLDTIEAQAFGYHTAQSNNRYIIISNFDELRFYIDKKTAYEKFYLFDLSFEAFTKFHLLLSYESISSGLTLKLKELSTSFEQNISKKLYLDYSHFRSNLFENVVTNNCDETRTKQTLLRLTQKLCDRLIFILFAEDRGLLKPNTIKEIRDEFHHQKFTDFTLYDIYKFYFQAISEGSQKLNIPKYNGGLFTKDEQLDNLKIDDQWLDLDAQKLSDYDFESDISVNILGHIFEQSLTDLEDMENEFINNQKIENSSQGESFSEMNLPEALPLTKKKLNKRKKDGIFYTPEYITRYIVQNTLGKLCDDKKRELDIIEVEAPKDSRKPTKKEQTTKDNLEHYRNFLLALKVLDPACGSGAFLNQALEFLIAEHKNLQANLALMGDITAYYDIEMGILENNLYGVDINEDAVEIAKLSLWLRTANKSRALTNLSDKIVCANSLLDMPFSENSFDVVIGNPPYIALNKIKDVDYSHFEVYEKTGDILALFVEKSVQLCKENGLMSFIVSNSWLKTKYGEPLKQYLQNYGQTIVLNIVGTQIFEDATVESCIITFLKTPNENEKINIINVRNFDNKTASAETLHEAIANSDGEDKEQLIMSKIETIGKPLKEWDIKIYRGILTGFNEAFIIDSAKRDELIQKDAKSAEIISPLLRGRDIQRYEYQFADKWLINTHNNPPIDIDSYPAIKEHLDEYYPQLEKRLDKGKTPYNLRNCAYINDFTKPKIIWGEISDKPKFAYDVGDYFIEATSFIMIGENLKYLLAILNSNLSKWYFERISTTTGMGTNRWKKFKLELLPIVVTRGELELVSLVDEILESKEKIKKYRKHFDTLNAVDKIEISELIEKLEQRVAECEREIDAMVYKLYGLTEDEIKVMNNN